MGSVMPARLAQLPLQLGHPVFVGAAQPVAGRNRQLTKNACQLGECEKLARYYPAVASSACSAILGRERRSSYHGQFRKKHAKALSTKSAGNSKQKQVAPI